MVHVPGVGRDVLSAQIEETAGYTRARISLAKEEGVFGAVGVGGGRLNSGNS